MALKRPLVALLLPLSSLWLPSAMAGQDAPGPSLLIAPFGAAAAPNMAEVVTTRVRERVDSLGLFAQVDWDDLLDRSPHTRALDPGRRAALECVQARQLAAAVHIDFVVCAMIEATPDGFRVEPMVFDAASGGQTHLSVATVRDRDALVDHVVAELRKWGIQRGGDTAHRSPLRVQSRGRVVAELRGSYVPLTEGNATVGATHGLGVTTQLGVTLDSIGANEVHVFYTLVRGRDGRSPRVQMAGAMLSLSRGIESRLTGVGAVGVGIINYTSENAGPCDLSYCSPDSGGSFAGGHHPTFIAGVALEAALAARFRVRADIREHFPIGAGDAADFTGDRRSDIGVGVRYLIS